MLFRLLEPTFLHFLQSARVEQELNFEELDSLFSKFALSFDAGISFAVKAELERIGALVAENQLKKISEHIPKTGKSSYLALALSNFILSLTPYHTLQKYYTRFLSMIFTFMAEHYVSPQDFIPILQGQMELVPENPALATLLAVQYLRTESVPHWHDAVNLLEKLVRESGTLDNFRMPYLLLQSAIALELKVLHQIHRKRTRCLLQVYINGAVAPGLRCFQHTSSSKMKTSWNKPCTR